MNWIKSFIIMVLALMLNVFSGACTDDSEGAPVLGDTDADGDGDGDADGDVDTATASDTDENFGDWECPVAGFPDVYQCTETAEACVGNGGTVADDYVCGGDGGTGGVCCDLAEKVEEGPEPCPEDGVAISCQLSWECVKAEGEFLWKDYFCSGDNTLCCNSPALANPSDGGPEGDAGL